LPERALTPKKPSRTARFMRGRVEQHSSPVAECIPRLLETPTDVIRDISPRDQMYSRHSDAETYFALGEAALGHIRTVLLTVHKQVVNKVLDLPSGHGRVLRWIKAEFPDAWLVASDIDHDGVDFCARTFGALPLPGEVSPSIEMLQGQRSDLIWSGSLLTHLDERMWRQFLAFFDEALVPGGVLVFTVHGRAMAERLRDPIAGPQHVVSDETRERVLHGYERGFGYSDYGFTEAEREYLGLPSGGLGISLSKPSRVCRMLEKHPRLQLVSYIENGWGYQDVVGCLRT
jgi:SAM-dependent methyltransferase